MVWLKVSVDFLELRTLDNMGSENPFLPCTSSPLLYSADEQPLGERLETVKALLTELSPKRELPSDSSRNSFDSASTSEWDDDERTDREEYSLHSYGPLTGVNLVVEGALSCRHAEEHLSSTCKRGLMEVLHKEGEQKGASDLNQNGSLSPLMDQASTQSSVRSILSWRKRKFNFRSPAVRGEPLLNKDYGEDGGDDIDFDRRLWGFPMKLSSSQVLILFYCTSPYYYLMKRSIHSIVVPCGMYARTNSHK